MAIEVRGARAEEMPEVLEMVPRVMGATREYFAAAYRNDPWARPEHSRIVRVNGRIVSHIRLYDRWQRIGPVPVHVGCVGDVCTLPEHRKRGYCRALLEDALRYWEYHGYDLSMIVSGVGVYAACGWAPLRELGFTVAVEQRTPPPAPHTLLGAKTAPAGGPFATCPLPGEGRREGQHCEVRRFVRGEDLTAVAAVYAAHCVERSLTTVRPMAYWERHFSWIAGEIEELFLVAESEGQIVAYSRCEGGRDRLTLSECCYLPGHEQAAVALFDAVLAHAVKRRFTAVQGHLPADHPALSAARELPGFAASESSLLLFRLVNLRRLLERLQPLLSERAHDEDVEGDLTLRVGDQAAGLQIRPGWVSVGDPGETPVEVEPRRFFELLFGAIEPAAGVSELPPAPAKLLSGLFPPGAPVYWRTDVV